MSVLLPLDDGHSTCQAGHYKQGFVFLVSPLAGSSFPVGSGKGLSTFQHLEVSNRNNRTSRGVISSRRGEMIHRNASEMSAKVDVEGWKWCGLLVSTWYRYESATRGDVVECENSKLQRIIHGCPDIWPDRHVECRS
ncbi:hypothetical protein VTN00DRAFT_599 [Thermoascus crustaceus]|uniref:uncharacterized protein n=1 Tax=Thermoascus crustaceus TaxID=5088 RepID=UPI003742AEC3